MSEWESYECECGADDPAIHTTQEGECELNCPTCDSIDRYDEGDCPLCN